MRLYAYFSSAWFNRVPVKKWKLVAIPLFISLSYAGSSAIVLYFDPLSCFIAFLVGTLALLTLQEFIMLRGFTKLDFAIWLMLLLPLNIRWTPTSESLTMDREWWGMAMSLYLLLGWGCLRPVIDLG
jgi:hypothetical protein